MIEARLLGNLEFTLNGQEVQLTVRKAIAMAAYLVLEGRTTRSVLADLLWSDLGEDTARRNVRQVLSRDLRKAFGEALESDDEAVWLRSPVQTDVGLFEEKLKAGELSEAVSLYQGPFLEGFILEGAREFEDWLEFKREQLAELHRSALSKQARTLETTGDVRGALEAHLKLLSEDELQETHQREAIRLHGLLGERERALERFEKFKTILKEELGLEPLPETIKMAEQARFAALPANVSVKETPLPAFKLNPPLVGRKQAWATLEASGPGLILLLGEPGVGKTRLALSFAATFGLPLLLRAQEIALETAHYPTAEALRNALSAPRLKARLESLEPIWRHEVARLIPELEPNLEVAQPLAEGKVRFIEALGRALVVAAGPGGAIVFDDLHWADASSLELVLHLARKTPLGPRLIATARSSELEHNELLFKAIEGLRRDGRLTRVVLEGLSETEVRTLVQTLSGSDAPLFAQRLARATSGNPLYLLETLRHLFEVGALQADSSGWRTPFDEDTADYGELPIPPGLREAILDRVHRLEPATQRLLEAASLSDDGFSLEQLAPTVALDEWAAMEALELGLKAGLLSAEGAGYRFSHPLVRRTLEDSLSSERRRLLHRRLAQLLETSGSEPARIASHLEKAGRINEATPWRVKAAQVAERTYAHQIALEHYAIALQQGLSDEQAFGVHTQRLRIYRDLSQSTEQDQEITALETLAQRMGIRSYSAEAIAERSEFWIDQGRIEEAFQCASETIRESDLPPLTVARLHLVAAWSLQRLGRLEQATQHFHKVIELAKMDNPLMAARAYTGLSNLASVQHQFEAAANHRQSAKELYTKVGDQRGPLNLLSAAARDAWLMGKTQQGVELLGQAIAGSRDIGSTSLEKSYLLNLIALQIDVSDFEGALHSLKRGLELVREPPEPRLEGVFRHREAQVRSARGELGTALKSYQESIVLADQVSEGDGRIGRRVHLAHVQRLLGNVEVALKLLKEAEAIRTALGRTDPNLELESELARCHIALGNPQPVISTLQKALEHPRVRPNDKTSAAAALGLAYLALGQPEQARVVTVAASDSPGPLAELLAVRLQLGDDPEAARQLLETNRVPSLEALALRFALARVDAKNHNEFQKAAYTLANSLPSMEASRFLAHLGLKQRSKV